MVSLKYSTGGPSMPEVNKNIKDVGTGFASFLSPPGPEVVRFTVGQPDFDTPENIKSAAVHAIKNGRTKYTAPDGVPELKEAICAKFLRDNELIYSPAQVSVGAGGKQILYNASSFKGSCSKIIFIQSKTLSKFS